MKKVWIYAVMFSLISLSCEQSTKKDDSKEPAEKPLNDNKELKAMDIGTLKSELGMEGKEEDGQFKVTVPQNDLNVMVDGFRIIPDENFFGQIPLVVTASDGTSDSDPYYIELNVAPVNDVPEIITPIADIVVDEDADSVMITLAGTETSPYFIDVDGDSIQFEVGVTGEDVFQLMFDGNNLELNFIENFF